MATTDEAAVKESQSILFGCAVREAKQHHADLTTFEKHVMRAMGLTDVRELDKMLAAPTSVEAALHREPPDEVFELAERMYEELDRQREAQEQFGALFETKFLN